MLVWKCVDRKMQGWCGFQYPMPGGMVCDETWIDNDDVIGGLHGQLVCGNTLSVRYSPGGYWIILDVNGPYTTLAPGHIKFKSAKVLKRYKYLHTLLKDKRMARQYVSRSGDCYSIGRTSINETGPCINTYAYHWVYGLTLAIGKSYLATGPGGKLSYISPVDTVYTAIVGTTRDDLNKVLQPYTWYKWTVMGWRAR